MSRSQESAAAEPQTRQEAPRPISPTSSTLLEQYLIDAWQKGGCRSQFFDGQITEEEIFVLANAEFDFHWGNPGIITFFVEREIEELKNRFKERFPPSPNCLGWRDALEGMIDLMNEIARVYGGVKNLQDIIKRLKVTNRVSNEEEDDAASANSQLTEEEKSEIVTKYHSLSPYRNIYSKYGFDEYMANFTKKLMIDSFVKRALRESKIDVSSYQNLPAKISKSHCDANYLRDRYVVLKGNFCQTSRRIYQAYKQGSVNNKEKFQRFMDEDIAVYEDIKAQYGGDVKRITIPFLIEGGNIIECKNYEGKDVLLIAVSNLNFSDSDKFRRALFLKKDGFVRTIRDYDEYCELIKGWAKKIGYDEVVMIHRDLSQFDLHELYHIDVFMNVIANRYLILPEENVITEETRTELKRVFGEENIILTNKSEREKFVSNCVYFFGGVLILPHPETPQSFADKVMEQTDFRYVFIPPFHLAMGMNSFHDKGMDNGLRCLTQNALDKKDSAQKPKTAVHTEGSEAASAASVAADVELLSLHSS